jgi:hypothetical protein
VTDETAMKNINGIIPDLVIQFGHLSFMKIHSLDATIWLTQRR